MIVVLCLSACDASEEDETVIISAAASLTDALQEATELFIQEHADVEINFNFGGSGGLREQIKQGAPADIVIFASQKDFDLLNESVEYVEAGKLLENELVLVTPKDNDTVTSIDTLVNANKIAVGTAESVPAGKYAEQSFSNLDLTGKIEDKFIYAEDVRAVLQYVVQDEVDAGVVYKTDALTEGRVEIVDTFNRDLHDAIVYPIGTLTNSDIVKEYYEFLMSQEAKDIFKKYGFKVE